VIYPTVPELLHSLAREFMIPDFVSNLEKWG
jgi:hypothetical protein